MKKFRVTSLCGEHVLLGISVKLKEFKEDEETENWPFRELVGSLVWLAISTRTE